MLKLDASGHGESVWARAGGVCHNHDGIFSRIRVAHTIRWRNCTQFWRWNLWIVDSSQIVSWVYSVGPCESVLSVDCWNSVRIKCQTTIRCVEGGDGCYQSVESNILGWPIAGTQIVLVSVITNTHQLNCNPDRIVGNRWVQNIQDIELNLSVGCNGVDNRNLYCVWDRRTSSCISFKHFTTDGIGCWTDNACMVSLVTAHQKRIVSLHSPA